MAANILQMLDVTSKSTIKFTLGHFGSTYILYSGEIRIFFSMQRVCLTSSPFNCYLFLNATGVRTGV